MRNKKITIVEAAPVVPRPELTPREKVAKFRNKIALMYHHASEMAERARLEFNNHVEKYGMTYAIEWQCGDVVEAEYTAAYADEMNTGFGPASDEEVLVYARQEMERLHRALLCSVSNHSTSPYANANADHKFRALQELYRTFSDMVDDLPTELPPPTCECQGKEGALVLTPQGRNSRNRWHLLDCPMYLDETECDVKSTESED